MDQTRRVRKMERWMDGEKDRQTDSNQLMDRHIDRHTDIQMLAGRFTHR